MKYPDSSSESDNSFSLWTAYGQGALIWFALDMQIQKDTEGKASADNVMKKLDDMYGRQNGILGYEELKNILKEVTVSTYEEFFNKYVFGKEF
jgi:predicted metalloprotease with PDZ domain